MPVLGLNNLSVCLCVDTYSGTTGYDVAYKRNQWHKWVKNKRAIFQKRREIWRETSEKANMLLSTRLPRRYCSDL